MAFAEQIMLPLLRFVSDQPLYTTSWDVRGALETYAGIAIDAVSGSPSITVQGQHSDDKQAWSDVPGLTFLITAAGYLEAALDLDQPTLGFLRFKIENTVASTDATFSIRVAIKGDRANPMQRMLGLLGRRAAP